MMTWVFAILLVLLLGAVAVVAAGHGQPLAPAYDDRPDALVPAGRPLTGDDLRRVRFSTALRGYRMAEVDALLDRLAHELDEARGTTDDAGTDTDTGNDAAADTADDAGDAGQPDPAPGPGFVDRPDA